VNTPKEGLEDASFDGVPLQYTSLKVRGSQRKDVHEYRRTAGGVPEKHGRALYQFQMEATFQATARGTPIPMWPDALNEIRSRYESGVTKTLVLPTIGRVEAFIDEYEQTDDPSILSGETATITFLEDDANDFLERIVDLDTRAVETKLQALRLQTAGIDDERGLFGKIFDAANKVLAIRDQAQLAGNLLAARISSLTGLIDEADATLALLNDPTNNLILESLHDLWAAAIELSQNPGSNVATVKKFTLDRLSTVGQVATQIYGSTDRAQDLLGLNFFENPLAIPAGTSVNYFAE
jgi:prophage DNA circulation protein